MPHVAGLVNHLDKIISLDSPDVYSHTVLRCVNILSKFLEHLFTLFLGILRHSKIGGVHRIHSLTILSMMIRHILNQEYRSAILQGIWIIPEMLKYLLHLTSVASCLLKGRIQMRITGYKTKRKY